MYNKFQIIILGVIVTVGCAYNVISLYKLLIHTIKNWLMYEAGFEYIKDVKQSYFEKGCVRINANDIYNLSFRGIENIINECNNIIIL